MGYLYSNLPFLFLLILPALVILGFNAWGQPRPLGRAGYNTQVVSSCTLTADQFYALVYERLIVVFTETHLPFADVTFGPRQLYSKRHIFSHRSVYLEVRYDAYSYFIYALPVAGELYVSTWIFSKHDAWQKHRLLKWVVFWRLSTETLFQHDIMGLFHGLVETAISNVVLDLQEEEEVLPLEEYERRPTLGGFYARRATGFGYAQGAVLPQNPVSPAAQSYPQSLPSSAPTAVSAATSAPLIRWPAPHDQSSHSGPDVPAPVPPVLSEHRPGTGSLGGLTVNDSPA